MVRGELINSDTILKKCFLEKIFMFYLMRLHLRGFLWFFCRHNLFLLKFGDVQEPQLAGEPKLIAMPQIQAVIKIENAYKCNLLLAQPFLLLMVA